jgi:hypothetical protein
MVLEKATSRLFGVSLPLLDIVDVVGQLHGS